MIFVKRCGHAEDDNIHLRDFAVIHGGTEPALPRHLNQGSGNSHNIRATLIKSVHFANIDVEAGHLETFLAKQKREREANVAHAHDADSRLAGLDSMLQFARAC